MKYHVYASAAIMEVISGKNILFLTQSYGLDYWRRRDCLTLQGNKVIIAEWYETEKQKFSKTKKLGVVEL